MNSREGKFVMRKTATRRPVKKHLVAVRLPLEMFQVLKEFAREKNLSLNEAAIERMALSKPA
jgi:hypothetical protein